MRVGKRNRPYYRLGAFDAHSQRDGKCLEVLGRYDPRAESLDKKYILKPERIQHWLSVGAQPTQPVGVVLKKLGITKPKA